MINDARERMIRNEQRKLTETFVNNLSAALIGVGMFVLFICSWRGVPYTAYAVAVGIVCHFLARRALGRPDPM
jgi:hypothetical protein